MSGHKATPGARGSTRSCRGVGRGACGTGSSAGRAGSELSGGGHGPGCSLQPRTPSPPGNTLHGTNKMAGWGGARVTGGGAPRLQSTPSGGLGPQSAPQPGEPCTAMSARGRGLGLGVPPWRWLGRAAPSSLHHQSLSVHSSHLQVFTGGRPSLPSPGGCQCHTHALPTPGAGWGAASGQASRDGEL